MQDLNDLYVFSKVVEHNGFTGAAKALGVAIPQAQLIQATELIHEDGSVEKL